MNERWQPGSTHGFLSSDIIAPDLDFAQGHVVCTVHTDYPTMTVDGPNQRANLPRRLVEDRIQSIAAAPETKAQRDDLLAACQEARCRIKWLYGMLAPRDALGANALTEYTLGVLSDAIAKAEATP